MIRINKTIIMVPFAALLLTACFGGDTKDATPSNTATSDSNQTFQSPVPQTPSLDPNAPVEITDDGGFTWNNYRDTSPTFLDGINPGDLQIPDVYYQGDVYSEEELALLPRHTLYLYDRFLENSRGFETGQKETASVDLLTQDFNGLFTQEGMDQLVVDYNSEPFNYNIISVLPGLFRADGTNPDQRSAADVPWKYSYQNIKIGYDKNDKISGYDQTLTIPVSAKIILTITTEDGEQSEYSIPANWRMFYEPDYGWQVYSYSL